jgi:hypothetical protein
LYALLLSYDDFFFVCFAAENIFVCVSLICEKLLIYLTFTHMSEPMVILRSSDGIDAVSLNHVRVGEKVVTSSASGLTFAESIGTVEAVHKTVMAAIASLQASTGPEDLASLKSTRLKDADDDDGLVDDADEFEEDMATSEPVDKQRRLT